MEGRVWVTAADGLALRLSDKNVFVRVYVFLKEPVSDDHVNSCCFDVLGNLDFLDIPKVGDELEIQIAGRLACPALVWVLSCGYG